MAATSTVASGSTRTARTQPTKKLESCFIDICDTDEESADDTKQMERGAFYNAIGTIPPLDFVEPAVDALESFLHWI